ARCRPADARCGRGATGLVTMRHAIHSRKAEPNSANQVWMPSSQAISVVTPNAPMAPYTASAMAAPRPVARSAARPWSTVRWIASTPICPTGAAIDSPMSSDCVNSVSTDDDSMPQILQARGGFCQRKAQARIDSAFASSWGWLLGGSVSWGTGILAALLLSLLARHGGLKLTHDPALLLALWLLSGGSAFVLLAATTPTHPCCRIHAALYGGLAC